MRRAGLLLLFALAVPALADGPVSRVFTLSHRPAREAVSVVEPLLSPEGSVLVRPRDNSLTVVDDAATVARVAEAIARFDAVPASFKVRIRLIRGSSKPPLPGEVKVDMPGLPSGLLPYASYQEIGRFEALTNEGGRVEASVGGAYSVGFVLRGVMGQSERVELSQFVLDRHQGPSGLSGVNSVRTLLRSNVSLLVGQTFVMVATPSEASGEALLLVLVAERAGTGS
jgi:hypothetical protein